MKKSDIKVLPEYFDLYINEVDDMDLSDAFKQGGIGSLDKDTLKKIGDKIYAQGKWTIKDILQHLIDCERIFNYRALTFARNDKTELPGFEENDYARETNANKRSLDELISEFVNVRKSTMDLFAAFDENMLMRMGKCNDRSVSVLALGFVIAGHELHHARIIRERYFPLANT